ncbi:MAG: tRNA 2-thiouridine(34) synthase MnmA [bacterium]|nr:tRNA 2-thiouridine(34) synthase MnmA [bacterium]
MTGKMVLIAMSGGVDSSVAAYLMKKQGFDCMGVTMKLFHNEDVVSGCREKTCCSLDDVEDARSVARRLGIPYYVFNFTADFRQQVMEGFVRQYEMGATPNPCIDCNRYLKFDRLYQRARELDCDFVVTGHYARIEERDGRFLLKKAVDATKDQSYVLYSMTQEQLAHTKFPLGELSKEQVRHIAQVQNFLNADKPDSQDICFVPDGDYVAFMESYTGKSYPAGDFVDREGRFLGKHRGAVRYTIGQRRGLGLSSTEPLYVCAKDMEANTVTVAPETALYHREVYAEQMNWIAMPAPKEALRVTAKIRYRQKEQAATAYPEGENRLRLVFDEPQRAAAVGQAVVLYDKDIVVGGGNIVETGK